MTSFTATIELDAEQLALLENTADFMGKTLQQLIDASLQSGIAHAEEFYLAELERDQAESADLVDPATAHRANDMDDDLPF